MAATPVVKVFLMLVARRKDSWETPSRPAIEPDSTVAPAARPMNNELMIFLQGGTLLLAVGLKLPYLHLLMHVWRLLLGVLQQVCSVAGRRILPGVVQPPAHIVLHPVSPVTVAQQEMTMLFTLQEESVT